MRIHALAQIIGIFLWAENLGFADGNLTSRALVTATVVESVGISSIVKNSIQLGNIDLLDDILSSGSTSFSIKANSLNASFHVWLSAPSTSEVDNAELSPEFVLARNGAYRLPLKVQLVQISGAKQLTLDAGFLKSGKYLGANQGKDATFELRVAETQELQSMYPDIPEGTYIVSIRANVSRLD